MLFPCSQIKVTAEGVTRPVTDLRIADRVFDPMTGTDTEISDILSRRFDATRAHQLGITPICVPPGTITSTCPQEPTVLSPNQLVLTPAPIRSDLRYPQLALCRAWQIFGAFTLNDLDVVDYFCVFFDRSRFIDVNGMLVAAYTIEDLMHV